MPSRTTTLMIVASIAGVARVAVAQSTLPTLDHRFTSSSGDAGPVDQFTPVAVSVRGDVLFASNASVGAGLILVDSAGRVRLNFGHRGGGPGEIRTPWPIAVTRTSMSAWDPDSGRYVEWDSSGADPHQVLPSTAVQVNDVTPRGLFGTRTLNRVFWPVILDRNGAVHHLLPAPDSFMVAHFGGGRRPFAPVVGTWRDGFVVGDPNAYRLALYHWDGRLVRVLGRDLAPVFPTPARVDGFFASMRRKAQQQGAAVDEQRLAQMRSAALRQRLPFFTPGAPIRADGRGRMWVMGMEGDSAFADLFSATAYLGRLHVACRGFNGFWDVAGAWLALACLSDQSPSSGVPVIKLFRVTT